MIHCDNCGVVPVPAEDLPVVLPEDVNLDEPGNPLVRHPIWKHVDCPACGKPAEASWACGVPEDNPTRMYLLSVCCVASPERCLWPGGGLGRCGAHDVQERT